MARLLLRSALVSAGVTLAIAASAHAAGWLPSVDLFTSGAHVGAAQVVLDAEGNATAVWDAWNGENTVVESAYRPAGASWQTAVTISAASGEVTKVQGEHDAANPRIAVDASGGVTAVWEGTTGNNETIIQTDYRPAGGAWQAPVSISQAAQTADTDEPWIAVDEAGDATAVWKQQGIIRSAYRPAGGAWQAPVAVSEEGVEALTPQAAVDAAGDATAVWMTFSGSKLVARTAYRPAGAGWQAAAPLSALGEEAGDPQIALDAHGATTVVWRSSDGSAASVRGVYRPAGGEWEEATQISAPGEAIEAPHLAVDAQGDTIVAWGGSNNKAGEYDRAASAYRPASGNWEEREQLSEDGGNAYPQSVAFDQEGNAAIAWQRSNATSDMVQVDYRPAGGEWEAPETLSREDAQSYDPVVVLDAEGEGRAAQGDATVVWTSSVGERCGIRPECVESSENTVQAAGYDEDPPASEEFSVPSAGTIGEPVAFSAPTLNAFSPVIDFGDGESASLTSAVHQYSRVGMYTVRFGSTELLGYRTSVQRTIAIGPAELPAKPAEAPAEEPRTGAPPSTPSFERLGTSMQPPPPADRRPLRVRLSLAKQALHTILAAKAIRVLCMGDAGSVWAVHGPAGAGRTTLGAAGRRAIEVALTRRMLRELRSGHSVKVHVSVAVSRADHASTDATVIFFVR
jgi:hypothetical protein